MLLHPSMAFAARDAVVDELVARSRAKGGAWTVGHAGVLLPGFVGPSGRSCSPVRARPPTSRPRPSSRSWPPWPAARPAGHRSGLRRPTPTVGTPRPRAGTGHAGRGHRRVRRRADRRHPDR
jgi:hypothetical protein